MKFKVFGRRGSKYKNKINMWMGNHKLVSAHCAINYGLQGELLDKYIQNNPRITEIPVINFKQSGNKYEQIKAVESIGELVPYSWGGILGPPNLPPEREMGGVLSKPLYSLGGRDIELAVDTAVPPAPGKYYQERIMRRRYEIRVHAVAWIDPEKWLFQKRVHDDGDNVIAWNFHNGGKFITIEDPHDPLHGRIRESVKKIMKKLNYQFGGVDFIIQNPGRRGEALGHYFIEWNLAPGWTIESTEEYYKMVFDQLKNTDIDVIDSMLEGIYSWEMDEEAEPNPVLPGNGGDWIEPNPALQGNVADWLQVDFPDLPNCGRPNCVLEPVAPVINFCPNCGAEQGLVVHVQRQNYCYRCGSQLRIIE